MAYCTQQERLNAITRGAMLQIQAVISAYKSGKLTKKEAVAQNKIITEALQLQTNSEFKNSSDKLVCA